MKQSLGEAYFQGRQDMESKLLPKIEELQHRLEMANDHWAALEGEVRKLRYLMETAQTMRDDYECYECAPDGRYDMPLHCTEILKDFDDAVVAVNNG